MKVGGARTLFQMPHLVSLGIGGGSLVAADGTTAAPKSVGFRLPSEALVFGGDRLTLSDIGAAAGLVDIGDRSRVAHLLRSAVTAAQAS